MSIRKERKVFCPVHEINKRILFAIRIGFCVLVIVLFVETIRID